MNKDISNSNDFIHEKTYLLFFLSGVMGLMYQVLWISRFGRLFGNSSYAIGAVLAAYMGGLGLGSYLLGKWADRFTNGLRVYAILEILVAVTALMVAPLLGLMRPVYEILSATRNPALINLARLLVSLVVLLPPTLCMGGTLPVLVRFCTQREREAGQRLGELYSLNTFGAVVGTLLAGFVLLPYLGEYYTLMTAALLNMVVFVMAWIWSRNTSCAPDTEPADEPASGESVSSTVLSGSGRILLLCLALAGFASMGFEIAWSRIVALILGSSVYAFTAMLGVFLIGLAIGAAAAGAILRRYGQNIVWFIIAEVGISVWLILTIPHYENLAAFIGIFNQAAQGHFLWILMAIFLACFFIMLVPAMLMGATIPFVMAVVNRGMRVGRYTGIVYASNTIGGIIGSLLSGFILVPFIGIQNTIMVCVMLNLLAAALAIFSSFQHRKPVLVSSSVILLVLMVVAWAIPDWDPVRIATGAFLYGPDETFPAKLVFHKDGVSCTVTVEEYANGSRTLRVNGKADASTGIDMANQIMTGLLPMLFKPEAKHVLVVGYGSGVSVASVCHYDVTSIDCAELERRVIEADPYFNMVNHKPLEDPRLTILVEDGRNIIETAQQPYDVIISEPSNPWMAGISALFTKDYYEKCRQGLSAGGVMCQWLQAYRTSLDDFKSIAATFASVFPYHALYKVSSGDYLILGSDTPLLPDLTAMQRQIMSRPVLAQDLRQFCGTDDIRAVLIRYFVFDDDTFDLFIKDAPRIFTDHHNPLGYTAVQNLFSYDKDKDDIIQNTIYSLKTRILPKGTQLAFTGQDRAMSASLLNVGNFCLQAGNLPMSRACFEWALKADAANNWADAGLLKIMLLTGGQEKGIVDTVQRIAAGDPTIAHETCRWLFKYGQLSVSRKILEGLVERYPQSATLKARLASAMANTGDNQAAIDLLEKAHQADPLNEDVSMNLLLIKSHVP